MTTLTDRYVHAVTRLLPAAQRAEVGRELRAMIGDLTAARLDAGEQDESAAEYAVLDELGDPNLLAASYVDRPRALVGQELFPEYLRVLKLVGAIAIAFVVALAVVGAVLERDPDVGDVVGAAIGGAYQAAIQTAFWVTLVYAFADRWKDRSSWTPDDLPDLDGAGADRHGARGGEVGVGELVFGIVITALAAVLLVWQQVSPFAHDDGEGVPFLDPDIWNGAGQALVALLGASLVVQVIVLARRRWTYTLAVINAVVNAAFLGIVGWLALDDRLVNQDVLELLADRADWSTTPSVNPWLVIVVVAVIEIWDSVEAFRYARRASNQ